MSNGMNILTETCPGVCQKEFSMGLIIHRVMCGGNVLGGCLDPHAGLQISTCDG